MKRKSVIRSYDPWNPNDVDNLRNLVKTSNDPEDWEMFGVFLFCTENEEYLKEDIAYRKAVDFVFKNAKIVEPKASEEKAEE